MGYTRAQVPVKSHEILPHELLYVLLTISASYYILGYELLGLALVHLSGNHTTWGTYDQMSVLPEKIRPNYRHTSFHGRGACTDDKMIVHQYLPSEIQESEPINGTIHVNMTIVDIYNNSCLNGW